MWATCNLAYSTKDCLTWHKNKCMDRCDLNISAFHLAPSHIYSDQGKFWSKSTIKWIQTKVKSLLQYSNVQTCLWYSFQPPLSLPSLPLKFRPLAIHKPCVHCIMITHWADVAKHFFFCTAENNCCHFQFYAFERNSILPLVTWLTWDRNMTPMYFLFGSLDILPSIMSLAYTCQHKTFLQAWLQGWSLSLFLQCTLFC